MFHPRSYPYIGPYWNKQRQHKIKSTQETGGDLYKFSLKMANTLSSMTNGLRNLVSGKRIRYKAKGYNLDLAYISDNIIAMGYPADNIESIYRNRLEDVSKFLEENHCDRFKVYNLCKERSYDKNKFHGRVAVYPFEDHNPPTIELIQEFCLDVDTWLKANVENVAAVHCKAGKGRTGTMICCYLLYSRQQSTAEDALSFYDEKRTKDRKGVTIPSQRRYVQYFSNLIRTGISYERRSLQLCEIRFTEANLLQNQGMIFCSISVLQGNSGDLKAQQLHCFPIDFRKSFILDISRPPVIVCGDIKIELTYKTSRKKIFHFWFNTFFVHDTAEIEADEGNTKLIYTLNKYEIDDAHKDKDHKSFSEGFKVQLVFYTDVSAARNYVEVNNHSTSQSGCLSRNSYPLPQNNSSGSELNHMFDHKSSSSASVSSLGGGAGESMGCFATRGQSSSAGAASKAASMLNNKWGERNPNSDDTSAARNFCSSYNKEPAASAVETAQQLKMNSHHNFVNAYLTVVPANSLKHTSALQQQQQQQQKQQPQHQSQQQQQQQQQHIHQPSQGINKLGRSEDSNGVTNISGISGLLQKRSSQVYCSSQANSSSNSNSSKTSSISSHSSSSAAVGGTAEDNVEEEDGEDDNDEEEDEEEDWESANTCNNSNSVIPAGTTAVTTITTVPTTNLPLACDAASYVLLTCSAPISDSDEMCYGNRKQQRSSKLSASKQLLRSCNRKQSTQALQTAVQSNACLASSRLPVEDAPIKYNETTTTTPPTPSMSNNANGSVPVSGMMAILRQQSNFTAAEQEVSGQQKPFVQALKLTRPRRETT